MHANLFESQLERLARTLTQQVGVMVVCQGDSAWTDGRQIVLPSVPGRWLSAGGTPQGL